MSDKPRAKKPPPLQDLAKCLANNHVWAGQRAGYFSEAQKALLKSPPSPDSDHPALSVVFILGAGASVSSGLPLGKKAASILIERAKEIPKQLVDDELEKLSIVNGLDPSDFETQLLALSKFDRPSLLTSLQKLFERQYYPALEYELIAHMLKHRFVDAVINYNFDELQDRAIRDELGVGTYDYICNDGDCPKDPDELFDSPRGDRLRRPLYIKPHGTASQKSSLRFTRGDYFRLPSEVHGVLRRLLKRPTCLVAIGYQMESIEFNRLVSRCESIEKFFSLKRTRLPASGMPENLRKVYRPIAVKKDLSKTLLSLWHTCSSELTTAPRGIERHELISQLFHRKVKIEQAENKKHTIQYLSDRTYVELALAIAKAKGFLTIDEATLSRAGIYFAEYKRTNTKSQRSLLSMCTDLGMEPVSYSSETLCLGQVQEPLTPGDRLVLTPEEMKSRIEDLGWKLRDKLSEQTGNKLGGNLPLFRRVMLSMHSGHEVEIQGADSDTQNPLFCKPIAIETRAALDYETKKLLSAPFDTLLSVAETGEWLLKHAKALANKRIIVVVADPAFSRPLSRTLNAKVFQIPWWLHNRHMSIFLRDADCTDAIVFERRLRTSQIRPILLSHRDDVNVAMATFSAYMVKAKSYMRDESVATISKEDVSEMTSEIKRDSLDHFRKPQKRPRRGSGNSRPTTP